VCGASQKLYASTILAIRKQDHEHCKGSAAESGLCDSPWSFVNKRGLLGRIKLHGRHHKDNLEQGGELSAARSQPTHPFIIFRSQTRRPISGRLDRSSEAFRLEQNTGRNRVPRRLAWSWSGILSALGRLRNADAHSDEPSAIAGAVLRHPSD